MTENNDKNTTRSGLSLRGFTLILTALSGVIWMSTSIFIPGLPDIGRELGMNGEQLSLTLTIYYLSFAALMPVIGPLSDAHGRRMFVLGGLVLYIAGSLGCGLAGELQLFYAGRVIQGLGVGMIQVPVFAMVRDECPGPESYTVLGLLGALTGIIPVLAVLIGGVVVEHFHWRTTFFILSGCGVAGMFICLRMVPETLHPHDRNPRADIAGSLATYQTIVLSRQVGLVTMPLLLHVIIQGANLFISPVALQEVFGLSPSGFSIISVLFVLGMAGGQYLATRAVKRFEPGRLYALGGLFAAAGAILFAALEGMSAMSTALAFVLPLTICFFSFGFMEPIGLKSLLAHFPENSGMASAVYGTLLLMMQAAGSQASGTLMSMPVSPSATMAIVAAPVGLAIALLAWGGRKHLC